MYTILKFSSSPFRSFFSEFVSIGFHIPFVLLLCATRKILVITLHHTPHLTTLSAPSQNSPLSQEYNPY